VLVVECVCVCVCVCVLCVECWWWTGTSITVMARRNISMRTTGRSKVTFFLSFFNTTIKVHV